MTGKATTAGHRGRGKTAAKGQGANAQHPRVPGFAELVECGKQQRYILDEALDALFEEQEELPDEEQFEAVRQALLEAGVEIVMNEAELQQAVEDIQLDGQLDRLEADGEPLNADA